MDLTNGDMLIFSGEGETGTWERYYGARTEKAIRSRLSRERCGGDRWASVWIEESSREDAAAPGAPVYVELDRDLDTTTGKMRAISSDLIRENPAAMLAASKRGASPSSAANGAKGGRPKAYHLGYPFVLTSRGKLDVAGTQVTLNGQQLEQVMDAIEKGDSRIAYMRAKKYAAAHDVYSPINGQETERQVLAERESLPIEKRFKKDAE